MTYTHEKNPTTSSSELTHSKQIKTDWISCSICVFTCFYYPLAFNFEGQSSEYKKKKFNKEMVLFTVGIGYPLPSAYTTFTHGFCAVRSSVLHSTRQKCDQVINNFFRSFLQNFDSQNIGSSSSASFSTQRLRDVLFRLFCFFSLWFMVEVIS